VPPSVDSGDHHATSRPLMPLLGKVALAVAAALLIGFGATHIFGGNDDDPDTRGGTETNYLLYGHHGPPREFLYLDPVRTQAYLSQFDGGLAALEKSTVSQTVEASAELAAGPAKVGGKHQAQSAYERSVTPTTASQFLNLAGYLDKVGLTKTLPLLAALTKTDAPATAHAAAFRKAWGDVREGSFVRIRGRITVPPFVRLYQTLRSASPGSSAAVHGQQLVKAIGANPRIPLMIKVDDRSGRAPLRLIFPLQYSLLATESSLIVGRVTIVGKVLYRIHPKRRPYRDLETWNRFKPETEVDALPISLSTRLRLDPARLHAELLKFRTVYGPAAIVLPLAIYK
jgi:hypothetical protein